MPQPAPCPAHTCCSHSSSSTPSSITLFSLPIASMCQEVWEGTKYMTCQHFIRAHAQPQARLDCRSQNCANSKMHPAWCTAPHCGCTMSLDGPIDRPRQREQGKCPSCLHQDERRRQRDHERERRERAWSMRAD
ncbi:hypothetical protein BKA62DRAFT_404947 [Auriculariales sp. MPI-PUGE-AT-0066]|nr:hypothetical protein BKA62DRAFT_404947 [Auriculariales sp. MPI-PUGE-AT-0066]